MVTVTVDSSDLPDIYEGVRRRLEKPGDKVTISYSGGSETIIKAYSH